MAYYIQLLPDEIQVLPDERPETEAFWKVEHAKAQRIDVATSELTTHDAEPGEDALPTLRKRFPASTFHKLCFGPGEYFPRMARPSSARHEESPGHNPDRSDRVLRARAEGMGQLQALIEQLEHICRIIHPDEQNFKGFGHEIRNVLILACTELEAQWKNILADNGLKGRTTTKDYGKLLRPMKLDEYEVELTYYPWLKPIKPFEKWNPDEGSSKTLAWYDAYNNVKHDRESKFSEANLLRAIQAVTGCFVMLCGQYGWDFALRGDAALSAFFRLIGAPKWAPSEIYVPPFNRSTYTLIRCPFKN